MLKKVSLVGAIFCMAITQAAEKDSLSMIYIGKGTKLVLKKNLDIPANANYLVFRYPQPNKYNDGCVLEFTVSHEDRRLSAGREIVFSGNVLKTTETSHQIEIERPESVKSLRCTNAWDGSVSIGRVKEAFLDTADLVFPEPSELPE